MLSKIEREEASPTAGVLSRISSALGISLASLVVAPDDTEARIVPLADQPTWRDPATGYLRRQVFLSPALPLELVEVELPVGASVSFAASTYALIRQVVWVLAGELTVVQGTETATLMPGDRLEFGPPSDSSFQNNSMSSCRYLVAVMRTG